MQLLPPTTKLGQGYIFTRVCDSVHSGVGWYPSIHSRWYPSVPCSRSLGGRWYPSMSCRFPGPHPRGEVEGSSWGVSRPTLRGACCRGCRLQGGVWGCGDPPVTATAAGSTQPTGMHSCFLFCSYALTLSGAYISASIPIPLDWYHLVFNYILANATQGIVIYHDGQEVARSTHI